MILRRCIFGRVIRALSIVLCFGNWIYCAPSSPTVAGSDTYAQLETVPENDSSEQIPSYVNNHLFRRNKRVNPNPQRPINTPQPDNNPDSQNFFQSFAPLFTNSPLGHSRPLLYPDHSFKPSFKTATFRDLPFNGGNDNILGSGNFGVVKGGTYYAEERDDGNLAADSENYAYSVASRHRKKNPPPAFRNGGDFFAHFRDFADITAPSKSYSQYYVVYVNKNSTLEDTQYKPTVIKGPKNIIEQLEMLDSNDEPLSAKESKQSKFKKKLTAYQNQDKNKEKFSKSKLYSTPKEQISEPLLALS